MVSSNTAQAWLPAGFVVVRTSQADEHGIAGVATCVRGTENWMWLASSTSFLRRVQVPTETAPPLLELDEQFLSNLFETESFSHSDLSVSLDVGELHSISAATSGTAGSEAQGGCDCILEVFGVRGYAMVGTHDGIVRESLLWENATDAVAFVDIIRRGRLRSAIVSPGFSSPAIVTVSAAGLIRASAGLNYLSTRSHTSTGTGVREVASMSQIPVWHMTDPGKNFMVVLGCFRAGVVLFPNKEGKLCASRFVLKGGKTRLTRYSVVILQEDNCCVVFEELSSGHRTNVAYDSEAGNITINLDFDMRLPVGNGGVPTGDQSSTLRSLLQGIETLGQREKLHDSDCRSLEDLISSYNSALLFVTEWKEKKTMRTAKDIGKDSCRIAVNLVNVGGPPRLQLPDPLFGRTIFMTVSFRNNTGVTLGDGWMLRMHVKKESDSTPRDKSSVPSMNRRGDGSNETVNVHIASFMTCPLKKVEPGGTKAVSFPIVIHSHAPFCISVALAFHHPVEFALSDKHIDIEVALQNDVVFDIFNLAKRTGCKDIKDSSHELLASSQLMSLFNRELVEKQLGFPTVSRFEVPFPSNDVKQILNFVSPSDSFETPLGAQFTVSVADIALLDDAKTGQLPASSIALRGVPHVLPFIRAAVLRRLLNSAAQKLITTSKIVVRDRPNIRNWQKSLVDTADECLPSVRTAETRLVEGLRLFREIGVNGCIEHCFEGQERDAMLAALQTTRTAYGIWRRENEHFWTPKGALYVGKK